MQRPLQLGRQLYFVPLGEPNRFKKAMQHFMVVHGALLVVHAVLEHLHRAHLDKPIYRSVQPVCRSVQFRIQQGDLEQAVRLQEPPVALPVMRGVGDV
ncbi:hypothetical protein D1872_232450 [compost metagenome]